MTDDLSRAVDEDRLVASLSEMISIQSVNPFNGPAGPGEREAEFAEYFSRRMDALGMETDSRAVADGRPNVWGRIAGSGGAPSVMLAGHMDTVGVDNYPDAFVSKISDGKLYGRGSCDMKAALACYLEAVRVLRESGLSLRGDVLVAGVADEEHLMLGSRDWGRNGPHADFGIIGEPTELAVCPTHKGQVCLFIRTYGRAVHSSVPELGDNAIERMARIIAAFGAYDDNLRSRPPHPLCGHGRFNIGVITGGTISSAVPDFCEIEIDRRTLPGETVDTVIGEYHDIIRPLTDGDPTFRYEIARGSIEAPPLDIAPDMPAVVTLVAAVTAVTGREAAVEALPASTDAPNMEFPCVLCGPGSIAQAHTVDEFVEVRQLVEATRIYIRAIVDIAG